MMKIVMYITIFIFALTPTGDQNLTFGITKKIKKDAR